MPLVLTFNTFAEVAAYSLRTQFVLIK